MESTLHLRIGKERLDATIKWDFILDDHDNIIIVTFSVTSIETERGNELLMAHNQVNCRLDQKAVRLGRLALQETARVFNLPRSFVGKRSLEDYWNLLDDRATEGMTFSEMPVPK